MSKPHSKSVTGAPCECGYLQRRANDPHTPFIFNELASEYRFTHNYHGRDAELTIYHCPFCGGVASSSHGASRYHDLNRDACKEIREKTKSCRTIGDVIAVLGHPTDDEFTSIKYNEAPDTSPRVDRVRRVTFRNLYDDVAVSFVQQIDGTLAQCFMPKPLKEAK